jgi:hypothetical protein
MLTVFIRYSTIFLWVSYISGQVIITEVMYNLEGSDNKHSSAVGTYLAACIFFKMITGESPLGLSRRFERKDEFGKKVFLGMIEKDAALKCQTIVNQMDIK